MNTAIRILSAAATVATLFGLLTLGGCDAKGEPLFPPMALTIGQGQSDAKPAKAPKPAAPAQDEEEAPAKPATLRTIRCDGKGKLKHPTTRPCKGRAAKTRVSKVAY